MGNSIGLMETVIKDIQRIICSMEEESIFGQTVENMMVAGIATRCMGKVYLNGEMGEFTKDW